VDGFNLDYRVIKPSGHRWLDIAGLADYVLGNRHQVVVPR
jgi:hypothetical protein